MALTGYKKFQTAVEVRRESRRLQIAALLLQGITSQRELAKRVKCSLPTIWKDMKAIRAEWRTEMVDLFDSAREEQLKKIDKVERNAWRGWSRSIKPTRRFVTKVNADGEKETQEIIDERAGDPRFLEVVRKCVEDRRRLLGLDAPEKLDIKAQVSSAAVKLQKVIENNGDFIEFRRAAVFGGDPVPRLSSNGDEQREMEAGETLEVIGHPPREDGDGEASAAEPVRTRPRNRLD